MNFRERRKYLQIMQKRYKEGGKKEKRELLGEMEEVTGLHRKSLIRLMNSPIRLDREGRKRERGKIYGGDVKRVVSLISKALDYPSAERLKGQLVSTAEILARHGEIEVDEQIMEKMANISISTLKRLLSTISREKPIRSKKRVGRKRELIKDIPAGRLPWQEEEAGHFEVDLVHHCGQSAAGEYVCSINMVDIATGWCEMWATLGRSFLVMRDGFIHILARVPFPIKQIHPDNGSEFFNWHLLRFWKERVSQIRISRSRPYHKNDNPFVEQRNHYLIRSYIGYDRLDSVEQTILLNRIYEKLWIYHNLFLPLRRTIDKESIPLEGRGYKVKRIHDESRTPLQRAEEKEVIEARRLEMLKRLRDTTNPLRLRDEIYQLIDELFRLPGASKGENVYKTLNLKPTLPKEVLSSLERVLQ
ncbi:MAG: transposase family protein [Deltaproteobacteria bacterium]|nr:transposase family protein [Deltaproteobacteria bacterium]